MANDVSVLYHTESNTKLCYCCLCGFVIVIRLAALPTLILSDIVVIIIYKIIDFLHLIKSTGRSLWQAIQTNLVQVQNFTVFDFQIPILLKIF